MARHPTYPACHAPGSVPPSRVGGWGRAPDAPPPSLGTGREKTSRGVGGTGAVGDRVGHPPPPPFGRPSP